MLAGVKEIDDLNRAEEVLRGDIPDPFGSIADHDLLFGAAPTALPSLQIEALSKLFRRFNRGNVGGRIGVADGIAFLVPSRLREHASQLGFPRVGRLPLRLARPSHSLLFHYGHSGPIQFYIPVSYTHLTLPTNRE